MTIKTLEAIHTLLKEDVRRKEAEKTADYNRYQLAKEDLNTPMEYIHNLKDIYDESREDYYAAKAALDDFESHEF